ncbi:MAG: hypothetical protein L0I84_08100 [Halomonas subglaciescola]|nr:hypothetical protein [Halomonas subglaciescola]
MESRFLHLCRIGLLATVLNFAFFQNWPIFSVAEPCFFAEGVCKKTGCLAEWCFLHFCRIDAGLMKKSPRPFLLFYSAGLLFCREIRGMGFSAQLQDPPKD